MIFENEKSIFAKRKYCKKNCRTSIIIRDKARGVFSKRYYIHWTNKQQNKSIAATMLTFITSFFSFIDVELNLLIRNSFDMFTNTIDKANRLIKVLESPCTLNCFESL